MMKLKPLWSGGSEIDDFKHLAIDMKTTVTALIIKSMRLYFKDIKEIETIGTWNEAGVHNIYYEWVVVN